MFIDGNCDNWESIKILLKEILIVVVAAFLVSAYFEFYLRKQISDDFNKILEAKEEFGKAGIIKYYPNFKDITDLRAYFKENKRCIEIYLTYGQTVFGILQDSISEYCKNEKAELNIFMLSPENKFIPGLGELWGKSNSNYDENGIKEKIRSSLTTLQSTFNELENKNQLKAKIKVVLLKRHPVFYSFYRFDDEMIYVPSKIVETKTFIPLAFKVKKTEHSEGIFNKCMEELGLIKKETESLEIYFEKNQI
jgi:hypothetical protein